MDIQLSFLVYLSMTQTVLCQARVIPSMPRGDFRDAELLLGVSRYRFQCTVSSTSSDSPGPMSLEAWHRYFPLMSLVTECRISLDICCSCSSS